MRCRDDRCQVSILKQQPSEDDDGDRLLADSVS